MSRAIQTVFGVRVTVIYKSGAKAHCRFRSFDIARKGSEVTKVEWRRPWLSWSREPMFVGLDNIEAIWQGRA